MEAVRGHAHLATPFVSRKRPRQADAGDTDEGPGNENELGKAAGTFRGFGAGVTRVYGEGLVPFPDASGRRQDAHCRRARDSKAVRRKGRLESGYFCRPNLRAEIQTEKRRRGRVGRSRGDFIPNFRRIRQNSEADAPGMRRGKGGRCENTGAPSAGRTR